MTRVLLGSYTPYRIKMQYYVVRQLWYHSKDSLASKRHTSLICVERSLSVASVVFTVA